MNIATHKKQVQTAYLAVISYLIQPSYTNQAKGYTQGLLRHFDLRITDYATAVAGDVILLLRQED